MQSVESYSLNYWVISLLHITFDCAVNCYALISGYVGVFAKYKYSNLAMLWCRVLFYSGIIAIIGKIVLPEKIGIRTIISSFLPVLTGQYWYFTAYFILFLFMPILNVALEIIPKKRMGLILFLIICVTSIAYPVTSLLAGEAFSLGQGCSAWWLMILYLIGGYIRKYRVLTRAKPIVLFFLFITCVVLTWLSKFLIGFVTEKVFGRVKASEILISYLSITILASAVFLLLLFERITIKRVWIKIIGFLSPLAFSVYLIHDNNIIREYIMKDRFAWIADLPWYQMVLCIIAFAVIIYLLCSFIDLIRMYIFKWVRLKEKFEKVENTVKISINAKLSR